MKTVGGSLAPKMSETQGRSKSYGNRQAQENDGFSDIRKGVKSGTRG